MILLSQASWHDPSFDFSICEQIATLDNNHTGRFLHTVQGNS
jgi:hypothetical protein